MTADRPIVDCGTQPLGRLAAIGSRWELVVDRLYQERRRDEWRTVGRYRVLRDEIAALDLTGWMAESGGPGDNDRSGSRRRIRAGRYPLMTHHGDRYRTVDHGESIVPETWPQPGLRLGDTGARIAIVIHPGHAFISSYGCLNPAHRLADRDQDIDFVDSRSRVIALIDDLRAHLATAFPDRPDSPIPGAWITILGEP